MTKLNCQMAHINKYFRLGSNKFQLKILKWNYVFPSINSI